MTTKFTSVDGTKTFEYGFTRIKDMIVNTQTDEGQPDARKKPRKFVTGIEVNGEELKPSKRFWTSLQRRTRFGITSNIFRLFDHSEVFGRVSERCPNDQVRYCIERDNSNGKSTLLAVTNPNTATIRHDTLLELLGKYDAKDLTYSNGVVRSTHELKNGGNPFKIGGDEFQNRYVIDTPIDGFGKPNVYLSLLRLICTNGAIGYSKAFRSELTVGKHDEDVTFALIRAMDGFNNEEGFAAMRDRFERAQNSWASVNEVQTLYKTLLRQGYNGTLAQEGREVVNSAEGAITVATSLPIFQKFHEMAGDVSRMYGLTDLDTLSIKRQKTLPAKCKVYDLLNFATEIATHKSAAAGNRSLQAYVGDLITNEYDLEGTCDQFTDWRDFFLGDSEIANAAQEAKTVAQAKK